MAQLRSDHPAAVEDAWEWLDQLYRETPTDPAVAGARAAAEWTTGRASVAPITLARTPAEGTALRMEPHHAAMVEMGIRPGDKDFARGASQWLFWWVGLRPLPLWLHRPAAA